MTEHKWYQVHGQAVQAFQSDPERALPLFQQASQLARQAGDYPAALESDYWTTQIHLYDLRNYQTALELAVAAALESRKPVYSDVYLRFKIQDNLVCAYMAVDPEGYAELIEAALMLMDDEMPALYECRMAALWNRTQFRLVRQKWAEADRATQLYLAESEDDPHNEGLAYVLRAHYLFSQQRWDDLLDCARHGQEALVGDRYDVWKVEMIAAEALACRKLGEEAAAQTAYRRATARAAASRRVPDSDYTDFLCAFHQMNGELEAAIALRQRQLQVIAGRGQHYWEVLARLALIRLLKQTRQPYDSQLEPARALIHKLRKPDALLRQLDEIIGDDQA
jgi:hypothetical protein